MCMCRVLCGSLSCTVGSGRRFELSTHQSAKARSNPGTSGPSCFRFTLPSACCNHHRHFRRPSSEAVQSCISSSRRELSPLEGFRMCGRWWGDGVQDQGKIDSSPLVGGLCGVSPHARPHTHTGGHPRVARPTHQHQRAICQPSFFFLLPSVALWDVLGSLDGWFQWFSSHSGVFQSFVTIFSYFHAHIHSTQRTPNTIKIINWGGLVFRSFKSHTRDY